MTAGQTIEIHDLTNNNGLLALKLGTGRIITGYKSLIHIIRLEKYQENINAINNSLTIFNKIDGFNDSLKVIKIKFDQLKERLQTLTPTFRKRRGLINGLGTVVKSITGNMDANDALDINQKIETLLQKQDDIKTYEVDQFRLNRQMIKRFDNITDHINSQQRVIERYLVNTEKSLGNRIRSEENSIRYIQYLNQINFNIELLNNHLANIAESIILAKLNIISKHILNNEELKFIYSSLTNQSVEIESNENIYELLELQAYYNHSDIIFNIQIPSLKNESFSFFHFIPIPVKNKSLQIKPFCTLNSNEIQCFENKCEQIENKFYCTENKSQASNTETNCLINLMHNRPAQCKTFDVTQEHQIYQPEPNYILFINTPEIEITSTCGPKPQNIKGTFIIHFSNCSINVNQVTYESISRVYFEDVHIYPTSINKTNISTIQTINLQTLQNFHFQNKEAIRYLERRTESHIVLNYTIISIASTLVGVVLLLLIVIIHREKKNEPSTPNNQHTPAINLMLAPAKDVHHLFDRTSIQGGGVTHPTCHPGHSPVVFHG